MNERSVRLQYITRFVQLKIELQGFSNEVCEDTRRWNKMKTHAILVAVISTHEVSILIVFKRFQPHVEKNTSVVPGSVCVPYHFLLVLLRRVARIPPFFWMVRSIVIVWSWIPNGRNIREFSNCILHMKFVCLPEKVFTTVKPLTKSYPKEQFNLKPVHILHGDLARGLVPPRRGRTPVITHCFII